MESETQKSLCPCCKEEIYPYEPNTEGFHNTCIERFEQEEALQQKKELAGSRPVSGAIWIPYKHIQGIMSLSWPEAKVMMILSSHRTKATGLAAPGLALLVVRTGLSKRRVNRALKKLQDRGAIKYHAGGYRGVNAQWHLLGHGTDGKCDSCRPRKPGGRKSKIAKVVS